ncbi:hypothetical protein vseg_015637 [Gypsophila vaccaria]
MATLTVPASLPDVSDDVEQLHKAFSGWGTNEDLIIGILSHRNATQRKMIREVYTSIHGEDLLKALDKELTSDFERLVQLFTMDPPERDAFLAYEATKRFSSSNWVLIELACTRSPDELLAARRAYQTNYKKSLEEDVAQHTTGDFRKLLVPLLSSYRYEGPEINAHLAKTEAKTLHEKISDKAFADEELVRIISTRSKAQLSATLNHYNNDYGHAITKDLKEDPKDDYQKLLRATIKCLTTPEKYFEKLLRLAINKTGTDEGALTRVVATRAEVDMQRIKEEYYRRNTVRLDHAIAKDTRGDYEKMLIELVGSEDA